jgi:molecular chaperone GrpE
MNASHPSTDGGAAAENLAPETEEMHEAEIESESSHAEIVEALRTECDQLTAERNELKDLLQRSRAEFDNFRRRVEREKAEIAEYGTQELMRSVVSLLDDFDRAVATESTDKVYSKGIELIHARFAETLKKQGLEPIDSKGRKFDPNVHEAVDRVAMPELEDETVVDEFQRGYNFKGRLLRPAMVRVSVK